MPALNPASDTVGDGHDNEKDPAAPERPTTGGRSGRPEDHSAETAAQTRKTLPLPAPFIQVAQPSPISPFIANNEEPYTPRSLTQRLIDLQYYGGRVADNPAAAYAISMDQYADPRVVKQIAAIQHAAQIRLHLENLEPQMQVDVWNRMSKKSKKAALAVGYDPTAAVGQVQEAQADPSWWQSSLSWVGDKWNGAANSAGDAAQFVAEKNPYGGAVEQSGVGDAVGNIATKGANAAQDLVEKSVGTGLYALSEPQEQVFHGLRTLRLTEYDNKWTSWDAIQKAWKESQDGNKTFDPYYLNRAQDQIDDPELFDAAKEVMSVAPEDRAQQVAEIVKRAGGPDGDSAAMRDMYLRLNSTDFQKALQLLDGAHISFGRMVSQDYGISLAGEGDFSFASGALDATARVTLDPWLLAGKFTKGIRLIRYGIDASRVEKAGSFGARIDQVFKNKNVIRHWEGSNDNGALKQINAIRESTDPSAVAKASAELQRWGGYNEVNSGLITADKSWEFKTAHDVAEYFKSQNGMANLFTGDAAFRGARVSKKNLLQHFYTVHRPGSVVDWMDRRANLKIEKLGLTREQMGLADDTARTADGLAPETAIAAEDAQAAFHATGSVIRATQMKALAANPWYRVGTMITRLTQAVPVSKDGKLILTDNNAIRTVNQMARTFAPKSWADQITADFARSNEIGRRQIWKGMMATLAEASGGTRTPEGKAFWDKFQSSLDHEAFSSVDGLDTAGDGQRFAILASDARNFVSMPNFSEMHAQAQRIGILSALGGHFTAEGYDWFIQRAFKPSVLLRPALAIRNAGEEVLRHVLDYGVTDYTRGRVIRSHLRSGVRGTGKKVLRDPTLDTEWRLHRIYTRPALALYRKAFDRATGKFNLGSKQRNAAHGVRDWFVGDVYGRIRRSMLSRDVGEEDLRRLEDLWDNSPTIQSLYARDILDQSREGLQGIDSPLASIQRASMFKKARRVTLRETGGYDHRATDSWDGATRWTLRLDKMAQDELGNIIFRNMDDREKAIAEMVRYLEDDPQFARRFAAYQKLGPQKWAENLYQETRHTLTGRNGEFQHGLYDMLAPKGDDGVRRIDTDAFDVERINAIAPDVEMRPSTLMSRDVIHVSKDTASLVGRLIDEGFDYVAESTNFISRQPIYFSHLLDATRQLEGTWLKAALEAKVPEHVLEAEHKALAKTMLKDVGESEPKTLYHGSSQRFERLSGGGAAKDTNLFHFGTQFFDDPSLAKQFASPRIPEGHNTLIDGLDNVPISGHVHSVWTSAKRILDINVDMADNVDEFEKLAHAFAKHLGFGDEWAVAQIRQAALREKFVPNDFIQAATTVVKKADGSTDFGRINNAVEQMLRSRRFKGMVRDNGNSSVFHILNDADIHPNRYPISQHASPQMMTWAKKRMYEMAHDQAVQRTLKYVDNAEVRSQWSVIARNLFPFWRAQEEFYRRWAVTAKHSPEAFRKAQLLMMGLQHSGLVQTDDNGNAYFVYPAIGHISNAMLKAGEALGMNFGHVPIVMPYRGQIRFLNQGIDSQNILPSVSPILGFPTSILARLYPQTQGLENAMLGEQGAGRNPWLALLPTPLRRLVESGALTTGDAFTAQSGSAAVSAIAALEAGGHGLPDDATPEQVDEYIQRIRVGMESRLALRAVFGMFAPTPLDAGDMSGDTALHFDGVSSLDDEFLKYTETLGYDHAIDLWSQVHPDQLPFTVGTTETTSGAYWKSTRAAGQFYEDHKQLFDKFPKAASFLFPQDDGDWDPNVFQVELANSLRRYKDPGQFYKDMKVNAASSTYYEARDNLDNALENARAHGDTALAAQYQESFDTWRDAYYKEHPLLEEYLSDAQGRAYERKAMLDEMRHMLDSPEAPQTAATKVIGDMISSYDNYQQYLSQNGGSTTTAEMARAQATSSYQDYMKLLAKSDPNAQMFYDRVFRYMG